MRTITRIITVIILLTIISCRTTKNKMDKNTTSKMEFIINKIQNERDGQTLFLKDDKGGNYITVISPANGNFVDVKVGNRISLIAKEIMESDPAQIISKDIKVITSNESSKVEYEKTEEETFWVNSRKTKANGIWGEPVECYQIQKSEVLNKTGNWDVVCDEIEYFNFQEGKYYQIKVLKKWLKNHENLMDRTPYDLELITVLSKVKDETYINPVKTKISTTKSSYNLGEDIELFMEIKNTGEKPYTFLPWGTPLENRFTGKCLEVVYNNSEAINYTGIMVKRVAPTDKDYVTLKTDEMAKGKVNLFEGYKLSKKGVYTIQFKETYTGLPSSNIITVEVK